MRWTTALAIIVALTSGCAGSRPPLSPPVPPPAVSEVEQRVFLIGDAGWPAAGGEPVLQALTREINASDVPTTAVFLGDNIYPDGMPEPDARDRAEAERRLRDQIDAVLATRARGIMIPGNHDWHGDGWESVKRQQRFVDEHGRDQVDFLPREGCPGPVVEDVGETLRFVVLDTQWWLQGGAKPQGPESACEPSTAGGVVGATLRAIAAAGDRQVIVLAHHPLLSTGPHGGHFTWQDHVFPLTRMWSWAWLPVPGIGSLYPLFRMWGITSQDQASGRNERMRDAFDDIFLEAPPLVYASGHDHVLEVLGGRTAKYLLVSGAGIYGRTEAVGWRDETLFAASQGGFMRLDVLRSGEIRAAVFLVEATGVAAEAFSLYLE